MTTDLLTELVNERNRLLEELDRLRAEVAVLRGTVTGSGAAEDDQPTIIHHDVPPNAPR